MQSRHRFDVLWEENDMMHPQTDIHQFMKPGVRVHLAGIGGVSMCPLAEVLQGMGLVVQGSDMSESATVQHLRQLGIHVDVGHSAENLHQCDLVRSASFAHGGFPPVFFRGPFYINMYIYGKARSGIVFFFRCARSVFTQRYTSVFSPVCINTTPTKGIFQLFFIQKENLYSF